jgi:hypothetical protein
MRFLNPLKALEWRRRFVSSKCGEPRDSEAEPDRKGAVVQTLVGQ